jgi:hypothetical protein
MMKRCKREPRPPTTPGPPLTYADAEEAQLIETVDPWFGLMDNRLRRTSRGPQRERGRVAGLWDVGPPRPVVYFVR